MADQNQVETANNVLIPEYQISEAMELAQFYCEFFGLPLKDFYKNAPPKNWQPPRKSIANAKNQVDDLINDKQKTEHEAACRTVGQYYNNTENRNTSQQQIWTALQTLAKIHLHAHLITPPYDYSSGSIPTYGRIKLYIELKTTSNKEEHANNKREARITKNKQANTLVHAIFSPDPKLTIKPSFWGNKYYNGKQKLKSFSKWSPLKRTLLTLGVGLFGIAVCVFLAPYILVLPFLWAMGATLLATGGTGIGTVMVAEFSGTRYSRETFEEKNNNDLTIETPSTNNNSQKPIFTKNPQTQTGQNQNPKHAINVGADEKGLTEQQIVDPNQGIEGIELTSRTPSSPNNF